ncbi:hypothetical protein [Streptomyces sp. NPDC051704]|uniref:hypothetical protein n=1 Tax=Streptomyces sp. NPDC051704 TaxID=3365671 RepID=UPI0037B04F44
MGTARRELWSFLRDLRGRAEAARKRRRAPSSLQAVERVLRASGRPELQNFSGKRISDWAPAEAGKAAVPQEGSHEHVVALAALWADWAGEPASERGRRMLRLQGLLEKARAEQVDQRQEATSGRPAIVHRTVREFTPWQLEVGASPLPGQPGRTTSPALTPYLLRTHDRELRDHLRPAASGGPSALAVLTGDSSTGKTRALYEAVLEVAPDHPLLRPTTARSLIDLIDLIEDGEVREGCVLWLNEFQRIVQDSQGEEAAAELADVLLDRPGILAVVTLWERPYWRDFTAQGVLGDPHGHTRHLLTGAHARRFRVPREVLGEDFDEWQRLAHAKKDARLLTAGRAGAADGQVIQHLTGGPELLDAYLSGPGGHFTHREHALVTAALDARRAGHQAPLPEDLLAAAADGALPARDRAPSADWAAPELAALTGGERSDGTRLDIRRVLRPLDALRESAGAPPLYEPSDYLLQHTAPTPFAPGREVPAALWEALTRYTANTEDLHRLQAAAWGRGLFRHSLVLNRIAARAGSPHACLRIVKRTARHPDAARAAAWAAEHVDVSDRRAVRELFAAFRASGLREPADVLGRRLAARIDPVDVRAVADLATRLTQARTSAEITTSLLDSLAAHADRVDPDAIGPALPDLSKVPAHPVVGRLALRAASHADFAEPWSLTRLLHGLHMCGAPDATAALVARAVAAAPHMDPDELPYLMSGLERAGDDQAVPAVLALGPASRIGLTDAGVVLTLLRALRKAGDEDGVRTLIGRSPARHVELTGDPDQYDWECVLHDLLAELRDLGAEEEFAVLADRLAARATIQPPEVLASFLDLLHTAGKADAARLLLARTPLAEIFYEDPEALSSLLATLHRTGSSAEFDALASAVVDDLDLSDPDFISGAVSVLVETDPERGLRPLLERARVHTPHEDAVFVVSELYEAGALEAARTLARHVAEHVESLSTDTASFMLWFFHKCEAPEAVRVLLDRGLVDRVDVTRYGDWHSLDCILEILCEVGATDTALVLAARVAEGFDLPSPLGIECLLQTMTAHGLTGPRDTLVRRAAAGAPLTHMNGVARLVEAFLALGEHEAVAELLRRDPLAQIDRSQATDACHDALLAALRKAGSPQADTFARWARAAGRLRVEELLPYGLEPDGTPAAPWPWTD